MKAQQRQKDKVFEAATMAEERGDARLKMRFADFKAGWLRDCGNSNVEMKEMLRNSQHDFNKGLEGVWRLKAELPTRRARFWVVVSSVSGLIVPQ